MEHHEVLIVGGGNAGISLAARLLRDGAQDVALVESQSVHRYRPLLNYVGSGEATMAALERPAAEVVPDGCTWIRDRVVAVDADGPSVHDAGRSADRLPHLVRLPRPRGGLGRHARSGGGHGGRVGRLDVRRRDRAARCGPRCGTCPAAAWSSRCRPSPLPVARPRSSRSSWPATTGGARACCRTSTSGWSLPGPLAARRARGRHPPGAGAGVVRRAGAARGQGDGARRPPVTVTTPDGEQVLDDVAYAHVVPHYRAPRWIADSDLAGARQPVWSTSTR